MWHYSGQQSKLYISLTRSFHPVLSNPIFSHTFLQTLSKSGTVSLLCICRSSFGLVSFRCVLESTERQSSDEMLAYSCVCACVCFCGMPEKQNRKVASEKECKPKIWSSKAVCSWLNHSNMVSWVIVGQKDCSVNYFKPFHPSFIGSVSQCVR